MQVAELERLRKEELARRTEIERQIAEKQVRNAAHNLALTVSYVPYSLATAPSSPRCRTNSAHVRQSRLDSSLGSHVKGLKPFKLFPLRSEAAKGGVGQTH